MHKCTSVHIGAKTCNGSSWQGIRRALTLYYRQRNYYAFLRFLSEEKQKLFAQIKIPQLFPDMTFSLEKYKRTGCKRVFDFASWNYVRSEISWKRTETKCRVVGMSRETVQAVRRRKDWRWRKRPSDNETVVKIGETVRADRRSTLENLEKLTYPDISQEVFWVKSWRKGRGIQKVACWYRKRWRLNTNNTMPRSWIPLSSPGMIEKDSLIQLWRQMKLGCDISKSQRQRLQWRHTT